MKTITMEEFRREPGEYRRAVQREGSSFLVTYQGKPAMQLIPVSESTVVLSDGTFVGERPVTFGLDLGEGGYG